MTKKPELNVMVEFQEVWPKATRWGCTCGREKLYLDKIEKLEKLLVIFKAACDPGKLDHRAIDISNGHEP